MDNIQFLLQNISSPAQVRRHGGTFGDSAPQISFVPPQI